MKIDIGAKVKRLWSESKFFRAMCWTGAGLVVLWVTFIALGRA